MRSSTQICIVVLLLLYFGILRHSHAGRPELAVLTDVPAVEFSTSGWSYTNTSNPFLLTPDYLTNAMIGVSRLKPGQPLLKNGPLITEDITSAEVRKALAAHLVDKSELRMETLQIAGREVAHAVYRQLEKNAEEYAFVLDGYVIHVLLAGKTRALLRRGVPRRCRDRPHSSSALKHGYSLKRSCG